MNIKINIWVVLGLLGLLLFVIKKCEPEPVTKTRTEYIQKTDTIIETVIKEVPKKVIVEKTKTVKGKDSIVYLEKPTGHSVEANQYEATIKSKGASADLWITTTGELLDVNGTINCTKEVRETTKIVPMSGWFVYGDVPLNNKEFGVGLMYQIRNKFLLKGGAQYNEFTKGIDFKIGVGIGL